MTLTRSSRPKVRFLSSHNDTDVSTQVSLRTHSTSFSLLSFTGERPRFVSPCFLPSSGVRDLGVSSRPTGERKRGVVFYSTKRSEKEKEHE